VVPSPGVHALANDARAAGVHRVRLRAASTAEEADPVPALRELAGDVRLPGSPARS